MLQKLMGMASAPGNIVAALGAWPWFRARIPAKTPRLCTRARHTRLCPRETSRPSCMHLHTGRPLHMDSAGNSDSFYKARESDAGFRASVFANPMVRLAPVLSHVMLPRRQPFLV